MPPPELTIRPYRDGDHEAVLAVHEAAFRASGIEFDADAAIDEELQTVTETYLDEASTFLVGVVGGEVVATGGFRPKTAEVAEVGHLRVHPTHQRRGVARTMMAELEVRAADAGFERFVLETHEDLVAARALYQSMNYEVTERRPRSDTDEEMIHYAKDLRPR